MSLKSEIENLWDQYQNDEIGGETSIEDLTVLSDFLDALEDGEIRAAEKRDGEWQANGWVKQGVLLNFGIRNISEYEYGDVSYNDVLPLADTDEYGDRGSRNTPNGTVVRRGASIGEDVIMMSPSFVNIGARVGDGTLVDSCDTVGSCAQIGSNVKLGANTLIGGVLEPVE
ncbi:MAG: 2,3,4,5-tetrahydropyridine-2,6-dicarboxylate N-succinyltransferase, partial [Halovenus sp.]